MEGVDSAYFCWPVKPGLIHVTVNLAQAAKEAGVSTIINLSQRSANRDSTSDSCRDSFIAEQVLNWSGLPVIHLRPTYFLEWLLYPWQLPYLQQGILRMPVGKGRHSPIAADDQGRAIAALLKNPKSTLARLFRCLVRSRWTMSRWRQSCPWRWGANRFSRPANRRILHIDRGNGRSALRCAASSRRDGGLPEGSYVRSGQYIEKLTGRRPMTVGEFARAHLDKLNPKKK